MANPFFTIGHSTRPIATFLSLLDDAGVRLVADVRTVPRSRTNPQYNRDVLPQSLAQAGIGYEHIAALGGLRGRQRDVPHELNGFWENQSFHNYADYALGPEFRAGFARLRVLGSSARCAIMCAEALWWQCHRRIIADYLLTAGAEVFHMLGPGRTELARLTPVAKIGSGEALTYPARADAV